MNDIYLLNYSVRGIKTLDQLVSLSFYKKTISRDMDTQEYNIKGIYGMNGSGKSGIITSVAILKNLLIDPDYLNNPITQKNLDGIINKKTKELFMEADYLVDLKKDLFCFRYCVTLAKDVSGKYVISQESLAVRKATSKSDELGMIFKVIAGKVDFLYGEKKEDSFSTAVINRTMNLLSTTSMCALLCGKFLYENRKKIQENQIVFVNTISNLYILGHKLHIYLDQSDDHREFAAINSMESYENKYVSVLKSYLRMDNDILSVISVTRNLVLKEKYAQFEKTIHRLYEFLHIFKSDLQAIEIDRKENQDFFVCDLVMVYDSYKIHAEYESTGIKKLVRLFAYLNEMVCGGIVFIDEFDSNLHDVYLCALLEYLMEYGKGQLCFTTHNVGPMDVLKQRKKSIDFLSEDHKIYPWTKSGNYSPSKLYRNGMIEGSPFNVDSIDFISVFGSGEEDE